MVSARDADQQKLVTKMSSQIDIAMPEWAKFVKTGVSRERQPEQADWYHLRTASVLRKIYRDGPVGVEKLRSYYGGLHRRGHKPAHFKKGSGKLLRTILQQLEAAGYVQKEKKGRSVTAKGQKFVDGAAKGLK
ncbi:MAG: 30S ribosomal protein S19e [Candidatus Aenigmarchaeota archaeon]|nr:30S ribosomal protein S19e [Candidatus Aenigmarchaeota archaeon]